MALAVPTSGRAWIGDVPVGDGAANRRALTGYLDQDPRFPGWMHGRELLELVGRLYGLRDAELRATVDEALERVAWRRTRGGRSPATPAGCASGSASRRQSCDGRRC